MKEPRALLSDFGERAVRFVIPAGVGHRRLFAELSGVTGVADVVLTEEIGCVIFGDAGDQHEARAAVERVLERPDLVAADDRGASHVIRVDYDGEDLATVAEAIGRSKKHVVALHSDAEYRVAMLGFLPGFAYLRGLASELRLPRRAPRPRVPPGSVAIAAEYSGVYPFASPGGWHLLGRAVGFEAFGERGAALALGDVVRFVPSAKEGTTDVARAPTREPQPAAHGPYLEITRAAAIALLVDGGRPGRMHEGVPPGGPLVRSLLARANAAVGNAPDACAVEVSGTIEVVARGGPLVVADDASGPITLADGESHVVSTAARARVRYLAIAGGIDAPVRLGSRGALLVAGIGGLLRKGHRLASDGRRAREMKGATQSAPHAQGAPVVPDVPAPDAPIAILPGPDAGDIAFQDLAAHAFRISPASDRTGTRLEGPPVAHARIAPADTSTMSRRSTPMVIGAIELTPSGLIVLGPDHPTTGGYPVVGVVGSASLDALFARPIGSTVRFSIA